VAINIPIVDKLEWLQIEEDLKFIEIYQAIW
jgi:hypothetical protein